MGGHHFGGQTGMGLHCGQFALGLFKSRNRGLEFAVGARQFFGVGQHLIVQLFRACAQQRLLPLGGCYIGINGDPTALWQRRALDADGAAVGAGAFHIMWHEGASDFHTVLHECFHVADGAIFTAAGQMVDAIGKMRPWGHQAIRKIEHIFEAVVAGGELQVPIIDAEGWLNQVQPRHDQCFSLFFGCGHPICSCQTRAIIPKGARKGVM